MLAKLKTITDEKARVELIARLDAWGGGREFDPDAVAEKLADAPAAGAPPKVRPLSEDKHLRKPPPRIAALEMIWGRGRWLPSSGEVDGLMLEALGRQRGRIGKLGLVGIDAIAADLIAGAMGEEVVIADWRMPCATRTAQIVDNGIVKSCDLDRMTCFDDGSLKALLSVEAMTYVDHKGGLAARVHRALRDGGRWAFMDYVAIPGFKPKASFASAWAEPQMQTEKQIRAHLETCGFRNITSRDVTQEVLSATRSAFARLGAALEDATIAASENGRDGALMLQELSWEATAWKARMKALDSSCINMLIWTADKPGADILEAESDDFVESLPKEKAISPEEAGWTVTEDEDFDASPDWTADEDETKPKTASDDADDDGPLGQDDIDNLFD